MGLSREEISIRLGVNSSAVSPGLTGARRQINKFADDSIKKLSSILKANVFLAAADLIHSLIPSAKEYWESFYGTSDEIVAKSDEAHSRIKTFASRIQEARKNLEQKREAADFNAANNLGKEGILEARAAFAAQDKLKLAKQLKATRLDDIEAREKILLAIERANEVEFDSAQALKELRSKMSMEEISQSVLRRTNRKKEVEELRSDVKALKTEILSGAYSQDQVAGMESEAKAKIAAIGKIIDERDAAFREPFSELAKTLQSSPDLFNGFNPLKMMGDAMSKKPEKSGDKMAQESAARFAEEISKQKLSVSIVEIKE